MEEKLRKYFTKINIKLNGNLINFCEAMKKFPSLISLHGSRVRFLVFFKEKI